VLPHGFCNRCNSFALCSSRWFAPPPPQSTALLCTHTHIHAHTCTHPRPSPPALQACTP
jgi:hypothetical protein